MASLQQAEEYNEQSSPMLQPQYQPPQPRFGQQSTAAAGDINTRQVKQQQYPTTSSIREENSESSEEREANKKKKKDQNTMGEVEEQPAPTGMLGWLGFGLGIFGLACLGISFASPYWYQTYPNSFNTFQNMGLWEVCFDNYMHHRDDSQQIYDGCWWVFDTDHKYWKLREWLLPPWFISVQVMMTACLLIEMGTVLAAAFIFLHFCPIMNHEYHQTYAMFACAALQFLATMILVIATTVYGAMCGDRQWMPRPDLNFMSWGFGFAIIYGMMALASGACFFLEARKAFDELMRRDEEYTRAMLDMTHATYPMSTSYAPSYAPSYGGGDYYDDKKPGYSAQPSYADPSQSGYNGDYYPQGQQEGYGQQGEYNQQGGYGQQPSYSGSIPAKA